MDRGKRPAWVAAIALVLGAAAAWGWARWTLTDRVSTFAGDVHGIGVDRGLQGIPSEERIAEQVRQLAAARELEVHELEVSLEALDDHNMERADYVTREVDRRVGKAFEGEARGRGGGRDAPELQMKGSLMEVRATVGGTKWLWRVEDEVEVSKVLGRRMEMSR